MTVSPFYQESVTSKRHQHLLILRAHDCSCRAEAFHMSKYLTNVFLHTSHSEQRCSQRGISDEMIKVVLTYGKVIRKQGLQFYMGDSKSFPEFLDHELIEKCRYIAVVVRGKEVITCYRNPKAQKHIRKKPTRLVK
ncbi:DUF4258 domain-containing protein [Limibacter armeniacum]|uniref:DUF4258 domain-containing protein n=1 Tax=Limibacter armeniacum TaxID=466084 RepID=UPI002FE52638